MSAKDLDCDITSVGNNSVSPEGKQANHLTWVIYGPVVNLLVLLQNSLDESGVGEIDSVDSGCNLKGLNISKGSCELIGEIQPRKGVAGKNL